MSTIYIMDIFRVSHSSMSTGCQCNVQNQVFVIIVYVYIDRVICVYM